MKWVRLAAILLAILVCRPAAFAYSVLTHEEVIDLLWDGDIKPLLLQRYPDLTPDQVKEAHAYAYGGSVIQDLGYYPFGSKEFSDLVHYVRSGDFVCEMVRQSQDAKEYAFALGAMAHYIADVDGHPAVNQAVSLEFPKLRARYGQSVTYADDKVAHLRTEFGFDVSQVDEHRYASEDYHNFIGFEVSEPLLERVFPVVYGMDLKDVLPHEDLAVGSYRWAISQLIPHMTRVAAQIRKKELKRDPKSHAEKVFLYRLSRADYQKSWGKTYQHPGLGTRFLAAVLRVMPKVGPFRGLNFVPPTPQTEDLYVKSINKTYTDYRALLERTKAELPQLEDRDLDTGAPTGPAEYSLADETYTKLLTQLADKKFAKTSPALRDNILAFYANAGAAVKTRKDEAKRRKVNLALEQLRAAQPQQVAASSRE